MTGNKKSLRIMNKFVLTLIVLLSLTCNAQRKNKAFDLRYFYHWESINPQHDHMEIIISKEAGKTRVTEFKADFEGKLGQAVIYSTVYICKNKKGRMVVETIDPSILQIINSEYVLTPDKKLLRVTGKDTITFKRRY
jgi:hypothetical protein